MPGTDAAFDVARRVDTPKPSFARRLASLREAARRRVGGAARLDPDAALVEGLRRGEQAALEQLIQRYADRVYRLARRVTGSNEDAEEVAQDTLWTVWQKIGTFRGESAFGSWLYRIAANAAYMRVRARKARGRELALDDVLPTFDEAGALAEPIEDWSRRAEDPVLRGELRRVLQTAIDELPADYRTALVLHDIEGLANQEIAKALGISLPAVKSRVHRSRLALRKRLSEYLTADDSRSSK